MALPSMLSKVLHPPRYVVASILAGLGGALFGCVKLLA